jgi:hypothetical protein
MKQTRILVTLGVFIALSVIALGILSADNAISPVETNAQQTQNNVFSAINTLAKQNKLSPTIKKSKNLAQMLIDNLSVLDIPVTSKDSVVQQVAMCHLNGNSAIDENNIVAAINNLATQSSAPNYAYTNTEQVKVVRKFLNRLIPDLVASSGNMNDMESFAVFTATLSQKVDNDAFMVTPSEFTTSLGSAASQPFPGSAASNTVGAEVMQPSAKAIQMEGVVTSYAASSAMFSSSNIITMIGIQ